MPDNVPAFPREKLLPSSLKAQQRQCLVLTMMLVAAFALQAYLVFTKAINWDEFFHFQHILELRSGNFDRVLQVLYVRWFAWLSELPIDPIDQLLVGRFAILALLPVTAYAIFALARMFTSIPSAILCALTYVTGGWVFLHAFAFRADPQATAVLMTALWLLASRRLNLPMAALIGCLVGLAGMITVKSAFYAPAFAGLFYLRWHRRESGEALITAATTITVFAALSFAALLQWHTSTLSAPPLAKSGHELSSASGAVFSTVLLPQAAFLLKQCLLAPLFSLMLIAAPLMWRRSVRGKAEIVAMTGLLLPVATVLFYRNSYPYNFVFILAPAAVTIFPAVEFAISRVGAITVGGVLFGQAAALTLCEPADVLARQKATSETVHRLFSQPVRYIGFCGLIGDYPRAFSFLTSGWGLRQYRDAGQPILPRLLRQESIPLLIDDHWVIDAALAGRHAPEEFLPADAAVIRENYVHYWGPVWLAGKRIAPGRSSLPVEIVASGTYTLRGAAIHVDGRKVGSGAIVKLTRGRHTIFPDSRRPSVLRWGDHLSPPATTEPAGALFTEY